VDKSRRGDALALDTLLRRHYVRINSVCRRLTGNEADADDATQEALLAIVRGLDRFAGTSRFGTWAYRVAVNSCLDELRRRNRRPQPTETVEAATLVSAETGVDDRLDIGAALARIPLDYRAAVVLRDLGGLEYAEIAEILEIPIGTVRSRIARGRAALVPLLFGNSTTVVRRPTS
jgi:RNA polymerase sigma-70 factor (ECF subfamily)